MSEGIPKKSSAYADEGTLAHEIAADILLGKDTQCEEEMLEHILTYVNYVRSLYGNGNTVLIEHSFDLKRLYPNLYGTADAVIYDSSIRTLYVVDFKYGAGIPVEVEDNGQLKYYALGALLTCLFPVPPLVVKLVVVQPRCSHQDGPIREWQTSAFDLITGFAEELVIAAAATEDPDAPFVPGGHCRFCPAAGICPALADKATSLAKTQFSKVEEYDPEKLSKALEWLPTLEAWISNVKSFAHQEAERGRTPPGWKLVAKRAVRKWKTDWKSQRDLIGELNGRYHLEDSAIYEEPKLKSPAQIEKLGVDVEKFVDKVSSGNTLVPDTDSRAEVVSDSLSLFAKVVE